MIHLVVPILLVHSIYIYILEVLNQRVIFFVRHVFIPIIVVVILLLRKVDSHLQVLGVAEYELLPLALSDGFLQIQIFISQCINLSFKVFHCTLSLFVDDFDVSILILFQLGHTLLIFGLQHLHL